MYCSLVLEHVSNLERIPWCRIDGGVTIGNEIFLIFISLPLLSDVPHRRTLSHRGEEEEEEEEEEEAAVADSMEVEQGRGEEVGGWTEVKASVAQQPHEARVRSTWLEPQHLSLITCTCTMYMYTPHHTYMYMYMYVYVVLLIALLKMSLNDFRMLHR